MPGPRRVDDDQLIDVAAAVGDQLSALRWRSRGRACGPARCASRATRAQPIAIAPKKNAEHDPHRFDAAAERLQPEQERADADHDRRDQQQRRRPRHLVGEPCDVCDRAIHQAFVRYMLTSSVARQTAYHGTVHRSVQHPGFGARAARRGRGGRSRCAELPPVAGEPGPARPPGRRVDMDARARADRQGHEPGACRRAPPTTGSSSTPTPVTAPDCSPGSTASRSGSRRRPR